VVEKTFWPFIILLPVNQNTIFKDQWGYLGKKRLKWDQRVQIKGFSLYGRSKIFTSSIFQKAVLSSLVSIANLSKSEPYHRPQSDFRQHTEALIVR